MHSTPAALIEADGLYMSYAVGARKVPMLRGVDLQFA